MTIQGREITFADGGRILIDGIRFRDWLFEKRACPFCGKSLAEPRERYNCDCPGWRSFTAIPPRRETFHGEQMRLL